MQAPVRRTGLGSCAKASTRAKTGTPTRTGRPGMWCMTATWLLVTVTGRTWNILRPLRMDSWPVVLHWPHTKGSPVGSLCTLPAWVPPWLGYIKLPASTISELLCESRLRLPRAQIGMHVHMNHKMRFDAIAMNVMGRIAELKLLQKKKIEEPPISMQMKVLLPITGEAGRVLLSTIVYCCILNDFLFLG